MIVICPECTTRYRVDEDAFGPSSGRRVRCAQCGHVWVHVPELPEEPPPLRVVPPMLPTEMRGRRRRRATLPIVVAVVVALLVAGYIGRDRIAAVWPAAAHFWEALGLGSGGKPLPPVKPGG